MAKGSVQAATRSFVVARIGEPEMQVSLGSSLVLEAWANAGPGDCGRVEQLVEEPGREDPLEWVGSEELAGRTFCVFDSMAGDLHERIWARVASRRLIILDATSPKPGQFESIRAMLDSLEIRR